VRLADVYRQTVPKSRSVSIVHRHHHHHHHHLFIFSIIQQYAHLRWYNFRRAGQQGPTRTLAAALKRVIKLTGYIFYHTNKILQRRKLEKSIFSMLFLKTFKDVKFRPTVDGSAFQTFITLSTINNSSCFCGILPTSIIFLCRKILELIKYCETGTWTVKHCSFVSLSAF